jgi:hypothetical protein
VPVTVDTVNVPRTTIVTDTKTESKKNFKNAAPKPKPKSSKIYVISFFCRRMMYARRMTGSTL